MIAETVEELSKQANCQKVWYLRSRSEFKVLTKDKRSKVFRILKRKSRTLEALAPQISVALEEAVAWLAETNASTTDHADHEVLEADATNHEVLEADPEVGDP